MVFQLQYAAGPLYTLGLLGFKVALLTSYLRMGGFVKIYRIVIITVLVAVTINQVLLTIIVCIPCIPVAKLWNPSIPGHCMNTLSFYYAIAGRLRYHSLSCRCSYWIGTSIAFDLIIIALPLPVLWRLSLERKQKVSIRKELFTMHTLLNMYRLC